jgi:peptidyl-prolyl cis-trans isomerase B (cyclophilin B)
MRGVWEMKQATIQFENGEKMLIELYDEAAPNTVANFEKLANDEFYDGLTFHRVIPDFVIQGGCPNGSGTGGPGYTIKCETEGNPHKHERGSLSMAHAGKDTGGSQFFVCHSPQPHLDGRHTVFGKVIEGVDTVDRVRVGDVMQKVRVEDK